MRALTVPEVARRVGRNPETVWRWIREGKLPATKVGTQLVVAECDVASLIALAGGDAPTPALPPEWAETAWGSPMPDVVGALRRSRAGR